MPPPEKPPEWLLLERVLLEKPPEWLEWLDDELLPVENERLGRELVLAELCAL